MPTLRIFGNMSKLELLKPKVRELAEKLIRECAKEGITIKITDGYRTFPEQDALYAKGRDAMGKVISKTVTDARAGYSFHNYTVAFDFCIIKPGTKDVCDWESPLYEKVGKIGKKLGLNWGGLWNKPDRPHFEYTAGYTINDFRNDKVDWNKFETGAKTPLSKKWKPLRVVAWVVGTIVTVSVAGAIIKNIVPGPSRTCTGSSLGKLPSCTDGPGGDGTPKKTILNGRNIGICSYVNYRYNPVARDFQYQCY